ncbi:MAG: methionyl-tRNA formyltransferase [Actinomycetota bacterium]|nr:methionyl-tRNA formyltransferase [Actinomycetota bacterium]
MRTVFFGTPEWAVPSLDALIASRIGVAAVVTNPDRPAGRGMELRPSPVKRRALAAGIEVLQPARARTDEFHEQLRELAPDVATVVAYGKILPASLLALPSRGFINLHFSLLPAYRGAAPVQRAIMEGNEVSGVSVIVLTEGMDEGPVLASVAEEVTSDDTAGTLGERLARMGAPLLVDSLAAFASGELAPVPQRHEDATYAPKITTEEARIDWRDRAAAIRNKVRGLNPVPGAWTTLLGKRVKVLLAQEADFDGLNAGALSQREGTLFVGTGERALELTLVQLQGKRAMSGGEAARGLRLAPGEGFE